MSMAMMYETRKKEPQDSKERYELEAGEHLLASMMEALHREGFRVTPQRKLILKAIARQVGWHVHPKEIYQWVRHYDSGIGLATVYRTLHMLEDMDLIQKIQMFAHAETAFPKENDQHYHMVCTQSGRVIDVYDDMLDKVVEHVAKKHNFRVTKTRLVLFGVYEGEDEPEEK